MSGLGDVGTHGSFTLKSRATGKMLRCPYCVWAKVDEQAGKLVYMQYMEDMLGTMSALKSEEG